MMEWAKLSKIEQHYCTLISVSRSEVDIEPLVAEEEALWSFSFAEGTSSIVGERLLSSGCSKVTRELWQPVVDEMNSRISSYLEAMDAASSALAANGISLVALKNSGIARGLHTIPAATPMGDVDVLVSPRDFRRAHQILERLGFRLDDRSPFSIEDIDEAEKHGGAEYQVDLEDGSVLWFELQWRPVAGRWIQAEQEPTAEELIRRSEAIVGTDARLLSPEDNLLQVCLHTAKHSYVRAPGFRLHTDVDRIAHYCEIDWDVFCQRVENLGLRTAVYLSLRIPRDLLGSDIPDEVLFRLNFAPKKHRLMLLWLARVGLFNPNKRKWTRPGYILFNLCLYDNLSSVWQAVFPKYEWMKQQYDLQSRWQLPFAYLQRIIDLAAKRVAT